MVDFPSLDDVRAARERIAEYIRPTPVVHDEGQAFKCEFLQHTGSFKARGAFNAALTLDAAARERGVVAMSGGNHGMAVAYVAHALGMPATIVMPATTPAFVVDRARAYGAEVELTPTIAEAFVRCEEYASAGKALLHPFDNPHVIAGQGTIGLELLEQFPTMRRAVISIGGGGLLTGIAATLKRLRPTIRVIGVETHGADAMHQALVADRIVTLPAITSIARTLGAPAVTQRTLDATRAFVDDVVVVHDRDAVAAMNELQERLGFTLEPAASCTLAALRTGAIAAEPDTLYLLCGRNVRFTEIAAWNERFLA